MSIFIYRAMDRSGYIVRNRVEESNKYALLRKLKENRLLPIDIKQVKVKAKKQNIKRQKMNIESTNSVLRKVREQELKKRRRR